MRIANGHWVIWVLTVVASLLYVNLFEWVIHKYVLHGMGKKRENFWSFHWIDHHNHARKNGFLDPDYLQKPFGAWDAQTKEIVALFFGGILHLPILIWVSPLAYATLVYGGFRYYYVHRRSHTDPEWAKRHLPWHWDHHMGANQNLNWCVTKPWFDWVLGTRKHYLRDQAAKKVVSPANG